MDDIQISCEIRLALFDSPYEWTIEDDTSESLEASFTNIDGRKYFIFADIMYTGSFTVLDVFFQDERGRIDITKKGDQFRVFATVLDFVQNTMESLGDVKGIIFSASLKEPSRVSLYRRFLKKYSKILGFSAIEEIESGIGQLKVVRFFLAKNRAVLKKYKEIDQW